MPMLPAVSPFTAMLVTRSCALHVLCSLYHEAACVITALEAPFPRTSAYPKLYLKTAGMRRAKEATRVDTQNAGLTYAEDLMPCPFEETLCARMGKKRELERGIRGWPPSTVAHSPTGTNYFLTGTPHRVRGCQCGGRGLQSRKPWAGRTRLGMGESVGSSVTRHIFGALTVWSPTNSLEPRSPPGRPDVFFSFQIGSPVPSVSLTIYIHACIYSFT